MATLAVFNGKGGVGKTTIACNLSAEAARAGYRVLLWEIDAQGDSSWLLGHPGAVRPDLAPVVSGITDIAAFIQPSQVDGLSLLPSDTNMRNTDNLFAVMGRQQRLPRLLSRLKESYDLIIFDCPPGMHDANLQLLQHADLLVMPCPASPLAMNSLDRVRTQAERMRGHRTPILPVLSMYDARRRMHREARAEHPDWPVIPYSSEIERMAQRRAPLRSFAANAEATRSFNLLWRGVEGWLHAAALLRTSRPSETGTVGPARESRPPAPLPPPREPRRRNAVGSVRRIFVRESVLPG